MKTKKFKRLYILATIILTIFAVSCFDDSNEEKDFILKPVTKGVPFRVKCNDSDNTFNRVEIRGDFSMLNTEVTQELWEQVMTGSLNNTRPSHFDGAAHSLAPVENITFYDAIEFCNRLSDRENRDTVYFMTITTRNGHGSITAATVTANFSKDGYRLPTEMEWMWAAMERADHYIGWEEPFSGATSNSDTRIDAFAWTSKNANNVTHQVRTKQRNSIDIHDLSGNVAEMCWDGYAAYPAGVVSPGTEPIISPENQGDAGSTTRVLRGGSYLDGASDCTVSARKSFSPGIPDKTRGFRFVRNGLLSH